MKDLKTKLWHALIGVSAGVVGLYLVILEWFQLKHLAVVTKDNTWSEIAVMTLLSVAATFVIFKVQWWIMDKLLAYSKKAIASIGR